LFDNQGGNKVMTYNGGRLNLVVNTPVPPGYLPSGNNSNKGSQPFEASVGAMAGMAGPLAVDLRFQIAPWTGAKAVMAPETWLLAEDGTMYVFAAGCTPLSCS
jgi:hypothetical protein